MIDSLNELHRLERKRVQGAYSIDIWTSPKNEDRIRLFGFIIPKHPGQGPIKYENIIVGYASNFGGLSFYSEWVEDNMELMEEVIKAGKGGYFYSNSRVPRERSSYYKDNPHLGVTESFVSESIERFINEQHEHEQPYDDPQPGDPGWERPDDEEGEPPHFVLTDGRKIFVWTETISGMAGEPTDIFHIMDKEGNDMDVRDIVEFLEPEDELELKHWMNDIDDNNESSAINWVI